MLDALFIVLPFLFSLVYHRFRRGMNAAVSVFLSAIVANAIVFLFILVINRYRAPALVHSDALAENATIGTRLAKAEAALKERARNKAFADALRDHDKIAVTLWAHGFHINDYGAPGWVQEDDAFWARLEEILREHNADENDRHHLTYLGDLLEAGTTHLHTNQDIERRLRMLAIVRKRIADVRKKHDPDIP